ncbi:MAG: hypothetical protein QF780_04400 [Candidatus Marinimicrobia bacterium]|jgi:hypothetical protein|nr:hypothetical protein [Candidatus Neomarinimicrobiota bacterium]|tara:strand:- start:1575 stop:1988 length:414 start_codon:yes stop_codon:yes gene_type:complete
MIREKTIILAVALVISIVLFEALSIFLTDQDSFIRASVSDNKPIDRTITGDMKDDTSPQPLQIVGWGDDIFYDRSNIYDSWFKLTGITQFQDGYKAIINGEIVHKMNRVRGFNVKEITKNRVVLERDQYSVTLKLEK